MLPNLTTNATYKFLTLLPKALKLKLQINMRWFCVNVEWCRKELFLKMWFCGEKRQINVLDKRQLNHEIAWNSWNFFLQNLCNNPLPVLQAWKRTTYFNIGKSFKWLNTRKLVDSSVMLVFSYLNQEKDIHSWFLKKILPSVTLRII